MNTVYCGILCTFGGGDVSAVVSTVVCVSCFDHPGDMSIICGYAVQHFNIKIIIIMIR